MDKSIYFMLLLCALQRDFILKVSADSYENGRIVGGYNISINEAPYQAHLVVHKEIGNFLCGGSIISSDYILTAAHCLEGADLVSARVGSTCASSGGQNYTSGDFIVHPLYNATTLDYDVGLIRFKNISLNGETIASTPLASSEDSIKPGTNVIVSGWGTTSQGGELAEHLMAVEVDVISSEKCKETYDELTPRMLCAGVPEGGKDSCQGDSGGPAVTKDGIQVGIVSYGNGCAVPGIPGVYTNVSSVRDWIKKTSGV